MKEIRSRSIGTFFALALFCAFSACMLLVLMTGANVYRKSLTANDERYYERTALAYVKTKLRGGNIAGGVSIEAYGDGDALVLSEEIGGTIYKTYIYTAYGAMREIFTEEGFRIDPFEGSVIVPVGGLSFEFADSGLLKMTLESTGGDIIVSYVSILDGEEASWD